MELFDLEIKILFQIVWRVQFHFWDSNKLTCFLLKQQQEDFTPQIRLESVNTNNLTFPSNESKYFFFRGTTGCGLSYGGCNLIESNKRVRTILYVWNNTVQSLTLDCYYVKMPPLALYRNVLHFFIANTWANYLKRPDSNCLSQSYREIT